VTKKKQKADIVDFSENMGTEVRTGQVLTRTSIPPAPRDSVTSWDPLNAFLQEIQHYPLLTPMEEKELANKYVETGDVHVAAKLVTSNLRLVVKIAFEYRRAYKNIMDLIQEGNIGLMQAVKKFDPSRGVKLSTYAAWWIRAYILRFVLNNWRLVKLGTTQAQRKLFFNLNKERAKLVSQGEDPTPELLADRLGVEPREIIEMDRRLRSHDLSLDAEIYDSDGRPLTRMELLEDDKKLPFELFEDAEFNDNFENRLNRFAGPLTGKDDFIFRNRLIADNPMTLQEIGDHFRISRERVRQIEKRLLQRLRRYLENELPGYFSGGFEP
jgi:RNA polymerase sigma-32 factor